MKFSEFLALDEEVVKVDFSKSTIGHKMPKGYTKFFAKQKGGKTWALWGKKEDGKEEEIKVYPTKEIADSIASEYNDALKAATQKPQKISMLQAFGSHAMNILHDAGIYFYEKPDDFYYIDAERTGSGRYKPLHNVALKKAEKELAKIDVKLKTYSSKELWGRDPKGPLESPHHMPPEQVFIVKMENGKRYLVDKTGAKSYIRMWARIL